MRCIPELELYIMISTWQVARRGASTTLTIFLSITAGRDALSGKSAMVLIFILRPAILCWTVRSVYKELHADHETGLLTTKQAEYQAPGKCEIFSLFCCPGFPKGHPFGTRLCLKSVVCYTLCRRCRENAVAAGEGKGI